MKTIDLFIPYGGGDQNPDSIVVHAMGEYIMNENGMFVHASTFLTDYKLSAHILVTPNGDLLRCRHDDKIGWHAKGHNTGSLGIEFLVEGEHNYPTFSNKIKEPYLTDKQYAAGVDVVMEWRELYEIQKVDRHSDLSPERKVDPGNGFPWSDFKKRLGV